MRIPPSVIVMSLVTAVPFGLGIRETLAMKDTPVEDEFEDDLRDFSRSSAKERRALAEYEAELAREAAEREARKARRLAQLDQLFGEKPATMGSLLDGIVLGANAGSFQPEHARERIEVATREGFLDIAFDVDAATLNAVRISVRDDDSKAACDKLENQLEAAWGPTTNGAWLDATSNQRAVFDDDACELRFDRYLASDAWVAALPIELVGAHVDKLTSHLGGSVDEVSDDFVSWHMPGLSFGKAATKLEAFIENDKIVGMKAVVDTDFDSSRSVRDALSKRLKVEAKRDEDTEAWTWKSRTPVTLEELDTNRFALVIGKY